MSHSSHWDLFCKVVDNFGDIGTCWRLARQLTAEHEIKVRLWVDDLQTFERLCPDISSSIDVQLVGNVEVRRWRDDIPDVDPADVVIEAFACDLPESYVDKMSRKTTVPIWINLEYLSAEEWVEGCHMLPSPHPTLSLKKYFFFPGFTFATGGLLRERDLLTRRANFDDVARREFLQSIGIIPLPDGLRVSLFCYDNPVLPVLLQQWSEGHSAVCVVAAPGPATQQISRWIGHELPIGGSVQRGSLTVHALPFLTQSAYDNLQWSCDVNFVRGEDSFVRAQWAQNPFVWQIYPQAEEAHLVKLDAFLTRYLNDFANATIVWRMWQAWNGKGDIASAWNDFAGILPDIRKHNEVWKNQLDQLGDLANNLVRFVHLKTMSEAGL
jgi:uncharacterized repeat protein (TIGR03837 family)